MKPLLTTLILAFLILPLFSFAQNPNSLVPVTDGVITGEKSGLVPCEGAFCSTCDVVVLANTGIKWLLTLSFLFFAVLAVRAGVNLVTSQGNPSALTDAKQSFTNAFIGLIIILAAWILVDTLLRSVLGKDGTLSGGEINGYGPWSKVECATQVTPKEAVANYFAADPEFEALYGNYSAVMDNPGTCTPDPAGPCGVAGLTATFGGLAPTAATILAAESGCNAKLPSGTDKTTDGRSYSIGLWQINLAAHSMTCNGKTLNCPSAFVDTGTRHPKFKTRVYRITDEKIYNQCVAMAENAQCNSAKANELVKKAGNFKDWACSAKKCGVSTPLNSKCPVPSIR